jgi:hypothetical protein
LTNLLLLHLLLGSVEETTMTFKTTYVIGILLVQLLVKIRFSSEIISFYATAAAIPSIWTVWFLHLASGVAAPRWPFASEELADAVTFRILGSPMLFQRLVQLESCKSLDTLEQHTGRCVDEWHPFVSCILRRSEAPLWLHLIFVGCCKAK